MKAKVEIPKGWRRAKPREEFDQYENKITAALAVLREVYDRLTRTDTDGLGWDKDNPLPQKIAAVLKEE